MTFHDFDGCGKITQCLSWICPQKKLSLRSLPIHSMFRMLKHQATLYNQIFGEVFFFGVGCLSKSSNQTTMRWETHHLTKADVTPKHGSIFCRVKSCWSKNKSKTKFPLLWYEHTNLNVCSILCCVVIPKLDKLHLHTFKKAAWHQLLKCKENSTPHFLLVWGPRPLLQ